MSLLVLVKQGSMGCVCNLIIAREVPLINDDSWA
jgi:hypothetical protein